MRRRNPLVGTQAGAANIARATGDFPAPLSTQRTTGAAGKRADYQGVAVNRFCERFSLLQHERFVFEPVQLAVKKGKRGTERNEYRHGEAITVISRTFEKRNSSKQYVEC